MYEGIPDSYLLLAQAVLLAAHGDIVAAEQLLAELEGYKTGSESDEDISQIALDLAGGGAGRKAGGGRKRGQSQTPSGRALQPGADLLDRGGLAAPTEAA